MKTRTLADLFAAYDREYLADKAPTTQYTLRLFLGQVLRDLGPLPLTDVTTDVIRAWKTEFSTTHKPSTVHRNLMRLGGVFRVAVEDFCWMPDNPVKRVHKPSPGQGRVRFLTFEERQRLLVSCLDSPNESLYPAVVLALATGGRKQELLHLQWPQVDLDPGVVRFLLTKTGHSRSVPLVGEALMLFRERFTARLPGIPWVFPFDPTLGLPYKETCARHADNNKPAVIDYHWQQARFDAGLSDVRFHDLRHTFASYMAMSGASLRDIAEVLGHRKLQQTMAYSHLFPSHTSSVVARMAEQFLSNHPPEEPPPCMNAYLKTGH